MTTLFAGAARGDALSRYSDMREVHESLTYAPLPFDTHPIDTAPTQWQGWGPFQGAWTPVDFAGVGVVQTGGTGVDVGFTPVGNTFMNVTVAPPAAIITQMRDKSTSYFHGNANVGPIQDAVNTAGMSSTISNSYAPAGVSPSTTNNPTGGLVGTLRTILSRL